MNDLEHDVLAFEQREVELHGPLHRPAKSAAIRRELDMAPARFYQVLERLSRDRDALELWPALPRAMAARRSAGLRATMHATYPNPARRTTSRS
ncbi:DUF3263 domain-containing protein [Curtobacterium oceanosedimentum]|uniref:DUF3263 domain-containing protein n=1 Tax=Curtobacterium oceanosedimentum TaxID=465820 RepID=UPI003392E6B0